MFSLGKLSCSRFEWLFRCGTLAKRKVIGKTTPIPCVVSEGDEEESSLAENVVREQVHPADKLEAFKRLVNERGFGVEEIAARFGVAPQIVRQRMRLGSISTKLMWVDRDGALTLEQMIAFAVTDDHARQEQGYDALSWNGRIGSYARPTRSCKASTYFGQAELDRPSSDDRLH